MNNDLGKKKRNTPHNTDEDPPSTKRGRITLKWLADRTIMIGLAILTAGTISIHTDIRHNNSRITNSIASIILPNTGDDDPPSVGIISTSQPTYTPQPTYTFQPTYTPQPTYTQQSTHTPQPVRTRTFTPTSQFTQVTLQPEPTDTIAPTRTATQTQTSTSTSISTSAASIVECVAVISASSDSVNIRNAPGTASGIIGAAINGEAYTVIGVISDQSWWKVELGASEGWISASVISIQGDCASVPQSNIIPNNAADTSQARVEWSIVRDRNCHWIVSFQLTGFSPNTYIAPHASFNRTHCDSNSDSRIDQHYTPGFTTDNNGNYLYRLQHFDFGSYVYTFNDGSNSISVTVTYGVNDG